jgi:YVTN family beta-propeller protein
MHKFFALILAIISLGSCTKWFEPKGYEYKILKSGNPQNLVFLSCGTSDMVGIDTNTFTVAAHIRMENMSIGGVTKLPQGGIAFTHERRVSDNAWGNTLYVTDDKYNIVGKYPVCLSPMAPKVVNNVLMVGSSGFEDGGKMKFQLYSTDNFTLLKEFLFEDMVDACQILEYGQYAYFDVRVDEPYRERTYSYIVQLDMNTLNAKEISEKSAFFKNAAFGIWRQDALLYVLNAGEKDVCVIDLNTGKIQQTVATGKYPEIANKNAWNFFHPRIISGSLYGLLCGHDNEGYYFGHIVKLNAATFALESVKKINTPIESGDTGPADQFYAGQYLVQRVENYVLFLDLERGEVAHTVVLDVY